MPKPPESASPDPRAGLFEPHRRYLFAVAYRILGIAEDAEDVVQDAWLRFASAPIEVSELERPRGYLVTIVTRLSIDLLRSARRQREDYAGVWLPEPLPTDDACVSDPVASAESVSIAFLLLLERLNPVERAVLVLHDVFDLSHAEVAAAIDRTPAASRQALKRARDELGRRTPRPAPAASGSDAHGRELARQFLDASRSGDIEGLSSALARDVVLMSDGGGKVKAASRPLVGRRVVTSFFEAIFGMAPAKVDLRLDELNGQPAMLVYEGEEAVLASAFVFDAAPSGLTAIYVVRNPDKLRRLRRARPGARPG